MKNLILLTDSYKITHWKQYPPGTEKVYSYFESRGGQFPTTIFFGLQYFLKQYLEGEVIHPWDIDEAEEYYKLHFGNDKLFNREGWEYIVDEHKGRLPVSIKAVPEGTSIPTLNVLMTIENTDPKCYWLTNYLETLLVQVWYPTTVATLSREIKKIIRRYLKDTGDVAGVDFKLHDFGFRGVSSVESALIGGMAHLVNFKGSDTIAALIGAKKYYNEPCAGFSIPAAEHSTIVSWGRENETKAYENMLDQFPTGLMACVSDSYDIYNACKNIWGKELKDKVLARNGCLVIRPDSGHPPAVVVEVLEILGKRFGVEINSKGYKVLNSKVRVIQGDGIDYDMINRIYDNMFDHKWSGDNLAFGMGGALLQKLDRDTQKFAFKCSNVTINGKDHAVWKEPIGDPSKNSKKGKLKLLKNPSGVYMTIPTSHIGADVDEDQLIEVFRDGKILKEYTFEEIRNLYS